MGEHGVVTRAAEARRRARAQGPNIATAAGAVDGAAASPALAALGRAGAVEQWATCVSTVARPPAAATTVAGR